MAFVHQSSEEQARPHFDHFGLADVSRISNLDRSLYRAFGLQKMRFLDLIRPSMLWRGFQTAILKKHGIGAIDGDEFQLPGVFLLHNGQVLRSHYYREPWDHPDFETLARV